MQVGHRLLVSLVVLQQLHAISELRQPFQHDLRLDNTRCHRLCVCVTVYVGQGYWHEGIKPGLGWAPFLKGSVWNVTVCDTLLYYT